MKNWLGMFRIPNLAIIVLTQYLLGYGIIRPVMLMQNVEPPLGHVNFFILVMVSLLIATGGYIINDHFDVNTDRKNKPGKNMLEGKISVRKALRVYYVISGIAMLAGFYLAYMAGSYQLGLIFPAIIGLLWFYSSRYQRMLFWGNFIVALLSALVVLIIWLFEFFMLLNNSGDFISVMNQLGAINKYVGAYALFAFLVSLIREMLKDIQDMKGDMATGYRTLPVVWGMNMARMLSGIMIAITIIMLAMAQWWLFQKGMTQTFWYLMIAVQSIFVYLLYQLFKTKESEDFGFLSNTAKIIMIAGILSMELIYISF
jgi:4-hydroxybenzoate polyprenyltransferase